MQNFCDVCGGKLKKTLPEVMDTVTKENFQIHQCIECELGHTQPSPVDISPYYKEYYGNRHGFTDRYCIRRRLRFLKNSFNDLNGNSLFKNKLLDIGCGDGTFLLAAQNKGWIVAGTEINPELARKNGIKAESALSDVAKYGLYDCITMWHTLEHMKSIRITLNQVRQLLKPEGKLMIAVPNWGGFQARLFKQHWLHLDVPRHLYHFNLPSLHKALSLSGFFIEKWLHQEFEYDLIGWSQSLLNTLFPEPNLFFDTLRGDSQPAIVSSSALGNLVLGSVVTGLCLPFVPIGTLFGHGGTLIAVSRLTKSAS